MTAEEARRFQDEWLASQPKWPQHGSHPLVDFANAAHDSLPDTVKARLIKENLTLTPTERLEQHKKRLELIFEHGPACRSQQDFIDLLYPGI